MSKGTVPITGTITTTNVLDTYPTHDEQYGRGGHRTVNTISQRDAIFTERRTEGMQVYIRETRQLQQLVGGIDNTKWITLLTIDSSDKVVINLDPSDIALSSGKLLIGDISNKASEVQTLNINNLPVEFKSTGIVKYDSISSLLKIAIEDVDYATVITLNAIAAVAQKSADASAASAGAADVSAGAASKFATVATSQAAIATTMAGLADGYAKSSGGSATEAIAAATLSTGSADAAAAEALESAKQAGIANTNATAAMGWSVKAKTSETNAESYYNNLISLGLSGLKNYGNVDFNGFRGTTLAPGIDPFDIATVSQITAIGGSYVKTVTGTAGNISSTGGQNPILNLSKTTVIAGVYTLPAIIVDDYGRSTFIVNCTLTGVSGRTVITNSGTTTPTIDIANTAVTPGSYTLSNITLDNAGRATAATSTTISGVSGRTAITGSGTKTMTVDIVNTAVTPGAYTLSNITLDSTGRATAATSNTLSGTSGRVTLSAFPNAAIDLAVTTVNTARTVGQYQRWDTYGRIIAFEEASLCYCSTPTQTQATFIGSTGVSYNANLPLGTLIKADNFSWAGGAAGILCNTTFLMYKYVHINLGLSVSGPTNSVSYIRLVKNATTTPVYYGFVDTIIGNGNSVSISSLIPMQGGDTLNVQYQHASAPVTMTTRSCTWTIG